VRYSESLSNVLVRVGAFIVGGSAIWSILPIVTEQELHGSATSYGILLGCIGAGSVIGAVLLAKFRLRFSPDQIVAVSGVIWGLATLSLGFVTNFWLAAVAMLAGGIGWVSEMSTFNVAAQSVLPAWVRARALAMYLLVFQGIMALSSVIWGWIAEHYGIRDSFVIAGVFLLVTPLLVKAFPIRDGDEREVTISPRWPEPLFKLELDPDRGPVLVQVEYSVSPSNIAEFIELVQQLGRIRRRDGAIRWGVFESAQSPGHMIESFLVESWAEHLRQHERFTVADRELIKQVRSLHSGEEPPRVGHFLAAS
jgi:MFS family permease